MYTKPIDWILSRLWRTAVILCWLYKCTYVNSGAQILLTPYSLQDLSQCVGLYPRWLNYTSIITNNCILFIHAKNKEMWKGKLSAASLLNSIILRERTAIPDIKVVIACWMGAKQPLSISLKLTAAARAIKSEAIATKTYFAWKSSSQHVLWDIILNNETQWFLSATASIYWLWF